MGGMELPGNMGGMGLPGKLIPLGMVGKTFGGDGLDGGGEGLE